MKLNQTMFGREGKVLCEITKKQIDILVPDDEVSEEYIEKCIDAMNSLPEETVSEICSAARRYCLKWKKICAEEGGEYQTEVLEIPVDEDTRDYEMFDFFDITCITIEAPEDEDVAGYQLSGSCGWEHEHGLEIVILGEQLLYLGTFEDNSPWNEYEPSEWNFAFRDDAEAEAEDENEAEAEDEVIADTEDDVESDGENEDIAENAADEDDADDNGNDDVIVNEHI